MHKNKKPRFSSEAFAPPQGLEPWTYGLTVRRSNQLSYGGIVKWPANLYFSLFISNKFSLLFDRKSFVDRFFILLILQCPVCKKLQWQLIIRKEIWMF